MAATSNSTPWSDEELRTNIGQLFIVGFHGHVPSEDIKTLVTKYKVGSVILFQRNVSDGPQLSKLTASLQELSQEAEQPLFIAIDQENGLVTRIKAPIAVQMPGSMALGATGDPLNAVKVASATAAVLKSFGINMNYAPIADINSEPKNPVIGVRSPSDDPDTVGRFVSAQIKGLSQGGIVPCVKHFPGHGDTAVDSHYGLPVISKSRLELEKCELVPFRRAVAEGVESVMTAHISMPGIGESKLPASLSPEAIKILREDMKYDGLIISDCLEMDGVRATYGTEKGAVMALKAGTDCVMICHTITAQVGAIEEVVQAVRSGELSKEAIELSVARVKALKSKFLSPLTAPKTVDIAAQKGLASEVYAKSTTVVRSEPGIFPLSPDRKFVFVSPGKTPLSGGAVESGEEKTREPYTPATFIELLRVHNPSIVDIRFHDSIPLSFDAERAIAEAQTIILATRNASLSPYQKEFGLSLGKKFKKNLIVIATCDPYDFLEETDQVRNYIVIYEPTIPAFKSAVDVVFGLTKATGTLPVGRRSMTNYHSSIRSFSSSEQDFEHVWKLWNKIFPSWPIELRRMTKILGRNGQHFVHESGFCLSFVSGGQAKVALLGVLPDQRGKGLGTALIGKAVHELTLNAAEPISLSIGSSFPRLWPGVPTDFPKEAKDFFLHRGFRKSREPTVRDLYRSITTDVAPPAIIERVAQLPLTYSPWSPALYEECMTKQRANFSHNKAWVQAYEQLAASNQHHEVMVAFDETGAQVGWTLMCSPSSGLCQEFAFLPLMPSRDKTGLIACVGVDAKARKKGIGLALLVKAMENMKERGIEGVCIDWVAIRGFYETLGYKVFWEYENYEW
ncbi:N-acetyl-beta-glucosaminidase [Hyphodiscus hymeniophilus]|uniref:N-acetyl-beta-glucosaminidase n=1 Tax=Hyphodiscus hymeniophilus TaxID=353542 RepID=A0A9P6VIM0_9HELO|nr:N-acetyl-beta-glucosaminidase [Hyphodiscus hymeniophilus]